MTDQTEEGYLDFIERGEDSDAFTSFDRAKKLVIEIYPECVMSPVIEAHGEGVHSYWFVSWKWNVQASGPRYQARKSWWEEVGEEIRELHNFHREEPLVTQIKQMFRAAEMARIAGEADAKKEVEVKRAAKAAEEYLSWKEAEVRRAAMAAEAEEYLRWKEQQPILSEGSSEPKKLQLESLVTSVICPLCLGLGAEEERRCNVCRGRGVVQQSQ